MSPHQPRGRRAHRHAPDRRQPRPRHPIRVPASVPAPALAPRLGLIFQVINIELDEAAAGTRRLPHPTKAAVPEAPAAGPASPAAVGPTVIVFLIARPI